MQNSNKFLLNCLLIVAVVLFIPQKSFATIHTINVTLSGAQEVPPAASPGTGTLTGTYDDVTNIIDFSIVFSGLLSPTNNAHFHAPAPPGVNAPVIIGFVPGFPLGVTSGNYDSTFTLTAGQETDLLAGLVYVNIHSNMFPGGEIRGQLNEAATDIAAIQSTNTPSEITIPNIFGTEGNNVGWSFTVGTTPITVTTLGLYDAGGNGLAEAHQVGIWASGGTLLASTTIPAGTAATLSSGYRYSSITPLVLGAGQSYVIGALYVSNSGDNIILNSSQTVASQITFNNSLQTQLTFNIGYTPPFGIPNFNSGGHNQGIFGPNLQFTPPPELTINDVTQNELNSSTSIFTFTVSLSAPAGAGGVTFDIATADGTAQDDNPATEDNDYVARALTGQTIAAGLQTHTFDVTVNGDTNIEPNETFFVNVTNVTGATVVDGQGQGTITNDDVTVLSALSPAKVWVGLKNNDAVGLRLDLKAEVFVNSTSNPPIGMGQLNNVSGGSSGFNNAVLNPIPLALTGDPVTLAEGDQLLLRVSVRRTCFGGGHNSGPPRLWYNGKALDSGAPPDAGSRFDATIDGSTSDYYLRTGFVLDTTAGLSRTFIDKAVNSSAACPTRPFISFGTWSTTP